MNKILLLLNAVTECVYIVCVTYAAIHFERIGLLWWYILVLFLRVAWGAAAKEVKK